MFPIIGRGCGPGGRGPRTRRRYEPLIDKAMTMENVSKVSINGASIVAKMRSTKCRMDRVHRTLYSLPQFGGG